MTTTWKKIFDRVCKDMEESGHMPDLLDYHLSPTEAEYLVVDPENISIPMAHLDYGGSEGIYLTLHVFDSERHMVRVGTFKTLEDSEEAMEEMAQLYGHFINALYRWMMQIEEVVAV